MMQELTIEGSSDPHSPVYITGTKEGFQQLYVQLSNFLNNIQETNKPEYCAPDGEGYNIEFKEISEDEFFKLNTYYLFYLQEGIQKLR